MEDDYFPEILHYCNIMYETLLTVTAGVYDLHTNKEARKLAAITMVAAGYAGDMPEDICGQMKYFLTKTAVNLSLPTKMRYYR